MYCENCHRLTEGEICPECGKKCKRDAQENDLCFLLSSGQIWADMACDVLDQEKIPYFKQGALGAAMTVMVGLGLETFSIYVPFQYYEQAREATLGIVPEPGEAAEELEDADDPEAEMESEAEDEND